jgi:hypothetical protein
MNRAAEVLVRQAEARSSDEMALNPCRAAMHDLERALSAGGDATGAAFARHLLALLRHAFLPTTVQLPPLLQAGVMVRAGAAKSGEGGVMRARKC